MIVISEIKVDTGGQPRTFSWPLLVKMWKFKFSKATIFRKVCFRESLAVYYSFSITPFYKDFRLWKPLFYVFLRSAQLLVHTWSVTGMVTLLVSMKLFTYFFVNCFCGSSNKKLDTIGVTTRFSGEKIRLLIWVCFLSR